MRVLWLWGLIGLALALAPGAAAQCSSSSSTTDLGVAQVTQSEDGCMYNWGDYGYEWNIKSVQATSGDASAKVDLGKYQSFGTWGDYSYNDQVRWASVQGHAADHDVHVEGGVDVYHYKAPDFCIDYVQGWVYVPPQGWGGWWGGPGNTLLPPADTGFWLGGPCTGALPLPVPLP